MHIQTQYVTGVSPNMLFGGVVFPLLACILEVRLEEERRRLAEEVGPGFIRDQGVGASNCLPVSLQIGPK